MIIVSHGGDAGDVIYALPTMRELARRFGSVKLELHPSSLTRAMMTPASADSLRSLIERQDYVDSVVFVNQPTGLRLDRWRTEPCYEMILADKHLAAANLPLTCRDDAWLTVLPRRVAPVVFHRSPRYHNPFFPWRRVWETYGDEAVFVGGRDEHAAFCEAIGRVPYHPTSTFLELAEVIAGSELFVGNQSCPFAIAEGLKHNAVLEVDRRGANCCYERANVVHGYTSTVRLPSLRSTSAYQSTAPTPGPSLPLASTAI